MTIKPNWVQGWYYGKRAKFIGQYKTVLGTDLLIWEEDINTFFSVSAVYVYLACEQAPSEVGKKFR